MPPHTIPLRTLQGGWRGLKGGYLPLNPLQQKPLVLPDPLVPIKSKYVIIQQFPYTKYPFPSLAPKPLYFLYPWKTIDFGYFRPQTPPLWGLYAPKTPQKLAKVLPDLLVPIKSQYVIIRLFPYVIWPLPSFLVTPFVTYFPAQICNIVERMKCYLSFIKL